MKLFPKKLRHYSEKISENFLTPESYLTTLKKSKEAFIEYETGHTLSYSVFLYQQSLYIKKYWWVLQGILLFLLWFLLQITENNAYVQRAMGLFVPLFVILIIPELCKNHHTSSTEIEGSTFYSLPQIYSARLLLFAAVDLLLLTLFFAASCISGVMITMNFIIDFFIPFNVTCCICFRTLCSPHICSEGLTVSLCTIWSGAWLFILLDEHIYSRIALSVWGGLLLLSLLYLIYCIRRSVKNCNLIWEVNATWN